MTTRREKRLGQVRANIPLDLKAEFEELVAEQGNTVSVSDYLFGMIEERVAMKAIRISKHKGLRSVSRS
jgi:hypothetical protein